jgi:hypothetical protein
VRKSVIRLVLWALFGLVMLRWFEHRQVFQPSRTFEASPTDLGRPVEDVYFAAADGVELNGWYFPAEEGEARADWVWLLCHGNAGNISHRLRHATLLLESTGAGVFLFDYRGYGRSRGRPSEVGTYLDAQAAHGWLCGRGHDPARILVLGESLGGAVGAELALRERVGGLVLVAAFTSVPDLGSELFPWLPVRRLAAIEFRTVDKLAEVRVPVMVIHSPGDTLVSIRHGERNYAAVSGSKRFWPIAGDHNDFLYIDPARYAEGLQHFLQLADVHMTGDDAGR